jgi:hypothetical protein
MIKQTVRIGIVAMTMLGAAIAQGLAATPEEAQAMADKAAALIAAQGDKAFPAISDPNGEFHKGELYVVVIDRQGVVRAHINSKLVGVNMWESADPDGVKFTQQSWKSTDQSPTAWISYKFTNPETKRIEPKKAWVHRVGDYVVQSGVYVKE